MRVYRGKLWLSAITVVAGYFVIIVTYWLLHRHTVYEDRGVLLGGVSGAVASVLHLTRPEWPAWSNVLAGVCAGMLVALVIRGLLSVVL